MNQDHPISVRDQKILYWKLSWSCHFGSNGPICIFNFIFCAPFCSFFFSIIFLYFISLFSFFFVLIGRDGPPYKCIKGNVIVGHLPREISRPTKYLLDRGTLVTATIMSEHYRKSLLFQGGLEIRCVIIVTMIATVRGHFCFNDMSSLSKLSMLSRKIKLLLALI